MKRRAAKRNAAPGMSLVERIARDRKAAAGMFRLLLIDSWDAPPNHEIIGDYSTPLVARAEGVRWISDDPKWLEACVYDDAGRNVWASHPAR